MNLLITGAGSGIGRDLVQAAVRAGHRVLATGRRPETLEGLPEGVETRGLDVRRPEDWEAALDAFGPVDVGFNVAGTLTPGWCHEIGTDEVERMVDVNVKGVIYGTRALAARMIPRRAGHIVNVASIAAMTPVPGNAVYAASKWAVRGFTLGAAQELAPHGVAATVVCLGPVETPMLDLQAGYDEAVWTFSAAPLTVDEVSALLLGPVLRNRPLEVVRPRSQGVAARVGMLAPGLATKLAGPVLAKQGARGLAKRRGE